MMDPAIKLFGKTIPVIVDNDGENSPRYESIESFNSDRNDDFNKEDEIPECQESAEETMVIDQCDDHAPQSEEDSSNQQTMLSSDDSERALDPEKDDEGNDLPNDEKNSQQKPLKKPDKILPCPRCNSMDTKFCYYNNYNVNQPRHFCKSCQRYWTYGGTMRNVPVGAGRRKNKSSPSRYCHITVSEALQAACLDGSDGVHHPGLKTSGTVLTFGLENPVCDRQVLNGISVRNGFHIVDPVTCRSQEYGDDQSSGSTVTRNLLDETAMANPQGQIKLNMNGFSNQLRCFQWPYMWNPAIPLPPFCPSAFPMSFYPPPPFWNSVIPWNFPWVSPVSAAQKGPESNPNSPTLGKHTRDGEMLNQCMEPEKSSGTPTVFVPKTLRIDDPDEAAMSSIWNTLGIKKADSLSKGGFFNSLSPKKAEEKVQEMEASPALKANPVALCRSMNFQESA